MRPESPRIVVPAHLGDKAAARLQRPRDAGEHRFLRMHPVQRGVREHRVELALEGEALARHDPRVEPLRLGRGDHVGRGIDRDDCGAGGGELRGQHAVAAAEIENALAGLGREQLDDRRAKGRHKMRGLGITLRRPMLLR
jgi:hypothetical protein